MAEPVWNGQGVDPWLPARLDARLDAAEVERSIRRAVWAALGGWIVQVARRVLRSGARPDIDAIHALAPQWREEVDLIVQGEILAAVGRAYARVLGADYPFDQRQFVIRYLAEVRNRLVRIPDEVYDLVAGQISQGVNLGEGIPQLSARVDTVLSRTQSERWPNRATVIARTEAIGAMSAGRYDAFRAAAEAEPEIEFETVWISTLDSRTREAHRMADGQRVPVGQPFIVGGHPLRFPGDPLGPAELVIQCRCAAILVEVGESVDMSNRQMKT
jgi:hypothetical protein